MNVPSLIESSMDSDASYHNGPPSTLPSLDHESTSIQTDSPNTTGDTTLPLPSTISPQDLWLTNPDGFYTPPPASFDPLPVNEDLSDQTKWMLFGLSARLDSMEMTIARGNVSQARLSDGLENLGVKVSQMHSKIEQIEAMCLSIKEAQADIMEVNKVIAEQQTLR